MAGLHSARQDELTDSPGSTSTSNTGPRLRVVTADTDGSDAASPLEQFAAALGRGDLSRARDSLLAVHEQQRAEKQRIELEKSELLKAVADLQQLLDERCQAHEQELNQQKRRLVEWHEAEKQALILESEEAASEIQAARECWETERQEHAAVLVEERSQLDADAEELRCRRSELDRRFAEITDERAKCEQELASRRQKCDEETKAEQQERIRVIDAAIAQRESEWTERQRQLEHELASQRKLHEKQLTLDRESFMRACSDREEDLDAIRADVDQQRKELVEERCRTAEQFSATRRQLEQDRTLLQNGLRQMEAQLRWVAGSISLSGGPLPARSEKGEESKADAQPVGSRRQTSGAAMAERRIAAHAAPVLADSDEGDSGWIGVVSPRTKVEEADEDHAANRESLTANEASALAAAENEPSVQSSAGRRQKLEDYRLQLSILQASLGDLQAASETEAESDDEPTQ